MICIILSSTIGMLIAFLYKPILRFYAERIAIPKIERILFPENKDKEQVLSTIHEITNKRFSDDLIMDYFCKIKGLQVFNINKPIDFWIRIYLTMPTKIKFNYFEQMKFYKTFLTQTKTNNYKKQNILKESYVNRVNKVRKTFKSQLEQRMV